MSRKPSQGLIPFLILIALGAGWGFTQPLTKIAVSGGYQHFGIIFWQLVITTAVLSSACLLTKKRIDLSPRHWGRFVLIALIGTIIPNAASYQAIVVLPAGLMAILLSLIPMLAFPIALALGNDNFQPSRLFGLVLGLIGVGFIVLPEASLPDAAMLAFVPLALIAPLCYAFEGNYVARWGMGGLDAIQLMCGASIVGVFLALPLSVGSGQWFWLAPPYDLPAIALIALSAIHGVVYTTYVWLVTRAGSVFAAQVSYLVTGFGVVWAMLLLGERYSIWIWAAFGVMLVGLLLVHPRKQVESSAATQDNEAT